MILAVLYNIDRLILKEITICSVDTSYSRLLLVLVATFGLVFFQPVLPLLYVSICFVVLTEKLFPKDGHLEVESRLEHEDLHLVDERLLEVGYICEILHEPFVAIYNILYTQKQASSIDQHKFLLLELELFAKGILDLFREHH